MIAYGNCNRDRKLLGAAQVRSGYLFGDAGDVLTFFDAKSIDPGSACIVDVSRSLGNTVRIN